MVLKKEKKVSLAPRSQFFSHGCRRQPTVALNHHPLHALSDILEKHVPLAKTKYWYGEATRLPEATLTAVAQRPRGKEKFDIWVNLAN